MLLPHFESVIKINYIDHNERDGAQHDTKLSRKRNYNILRIFKENAIWSFVEYRQD